MKNIINFLLLVTTAAVGFGQNPCTSILVDPVRIHTDNDNVVIVEPQAVPTDPNSLPPTSPSDYKPKIVSWLHGMGGDESSWNFASTYAEAEYNAIPIREEYSQASDMNVSISSMNEIHGFRYDNTKSRVSPDRQKYSFAIAHSLGGIVARGVSARYEPSPEWMNGLVTFNTAHKGSKLANYLHYVPGEKPTAVADLEDFVRQSVHDLANPWIAYKKYTSGIGIIDRLGFFDLDEIIANNEDNLLFHKSVSNMVDQVLKDIGTPAAADLTPAYLASSTFQDKLPADRKMMVYSNIIPQHIEAQEPNTSAFKMFYTARKGVNNAGAFQSGSYTDLALEQLNDNMQLYEDKAEVFDGIWNMRIGPGWLPIGGKGKLLIALVYDVYLNWDPFITYNDMRRTRDKFNRGHATFHKVNNYWEHMCGTVAQSQQSSGTCFCTYSNNTNDYGEPMEQVFYDLTEVECDEKDDANNAECSFEPFYQTIKHGYDGFITDDSQSGWNGVLEDHILYFIGSDHLQIRNDANTRTAIDNIFKKKSRFFGQ